MNIKINEKLIKVIANFAIFLEFTSSDLLNEDVAMDAMEQLASELLLIDDICRAELCAKFKELSLEYDQANKAAFVASLPEALGLE